MSKLEKYKTFDATHSRGVEVENQVNGNTRIREKETNDGNLYTKYFQEANGKTTKETFTTRSNNMQVTKKTY